jgi:glycerophosphoryl diester phosphodiesterase
MMVNRCFPPILILLMPAIAVAEEKPPQIVGHRGLLRHAPENTLAGFRACLELRVGFELDVRRCKDGRLVVMHDDNLKRTIGIDAAIADKNLDELKKLDAGRLFGPEFAGERIPSLDEVFALLKAHRHENTLVALDLKVDDAHFADDLAGLVRKYGVQDQVVCIGLAIESADLRKRLRAADAKLPAAVLAKDAGALSAALRDPSAGWVYIRFVPTGEQARQVHRAGKKLFLVGPKVAGHELENWLRARQAGVDAILTDFLLECRRTFRSPAVRSKPDVVIYEGTYPGWPWVCAGADSTLYCVFREGTIHDFSAAGKAMICTSRDQGRTWSKAAVIVDEPNVDDRNVAIVELPNKDLLVTYNRYTRMKESLAMTVRSSDGGKTWSTPRPVGEANSRTKSAAVVLSDGTLLLPFYVAPGNGALAAVSKDNGATWKTARVPDAEGFVGDEWDALEVSPGKIVGVLRNSHRTTDGTFWITRSTDGGRTWTTPQRSNVRSDRFPSPAQICRQGQTPTLIFADRRMVSVSAVRGSDPSFLRWDLEHRLPCYLYNADESPIADGSYPVSAAIGGSRRLIVDYEIRKDSRRIVGYFVDFPNNW